jgi:hypothetical protein
METPAMDTFFLMSTMMNSVGPMSWSTLRSLADAFFHASSRDRHGRKVHLPDRELRQHRCPG